MRNRFQTTLSAVSEGDAVAGIVYATDAHAAADRVESVPIPAGEELLASYPIAVLTGSDASGDM